MSVLRYSKRLRRRSQGKKNKPRPTRGSTRRAHTRKKQPRPTRRSTRPKGVPSKNTVFLCYRSIDAGWALAIAQNLRAYGYDVYMADESMRNGAFKRVILKEIRARTHFLVLLTPKSLDRCKEAEDWLRLEIEQALATKRNIIPVMLEGFDFNTPAIAARLTGKLALLKEYHGLTVPKQLFEEAMTRLQEKFLR